MYTDFRVVPGPSALHEIFFAPYIPMPEGRGFTALLVKGSEFLLFGNSLNQKEEKTGFRYDVINNIARSSFKQQLV